MPLPYVQDDMLFSQDFLTYMEATAGLLDVDPTIWCISSWNDNGLNHLEWRNARLVCSTSLDFTSVWALWARRTWVICPVTALQMHTFGGVCLEWCNLAADRAYSSGPLTFLVLVG